MQFLDMEMTQVVQSILNIMITLQIYKFSILVADDLLMKGAMASAGIILT